MEVRFARGVRRRVFARPREIVVAREPAETGEAFARLDAALASGLSVAGYLAYELGAAWHGVEPRATGEPLLCVGVYDGRDEAGAVDAADDGAPFSPSVAGISRAAYDDALARIAERLRDGDAYQVNFTVPFASRFERDPRAAFERLVARALVPYAACVETEERAFLSLSPELFLEFDGDVVRTRPMKGTAALEDVASLASAKNRAEHVMIVDLLRNDLARICQDVRVEAFATVERYPTFATTTSTIAGRLRPGLGLEAIFRATFPCGSVTGAPKRSAMRTIRALEDGPRGIAMGSIGFLEPHADGPRGWWNVAIRTLAVDRRRGTAELRVGGGIVADSTPEAEWREIAVKRRLFADLEAPVGLIETIRAERGTAPLLERHLVRLCESARALDLAYDAAELRSRIERLVAATRATSLVRVRVREGAVSVELAPFEPTPLAATVCVAPRRLDEREPLLRHKTDRRAVYDAALAFARERGCFEGIVLDRTDAVADASRTSVFVDDGAGGLATPRLRDGALDGLERRRLLESGRARERRIDVAELASGVPVYLASAARGLFRVTLTIEPGAAVAVATAVSPVSVARSKHRDR